MNTMREHKPRGLVTEMARAIGWLAIGAGVSRLPETKKRERAVAPPMPMLVTVAASIVGFVLALVPRRTPKTHQ